MSQLRLFLTLCTLAYRVILLTLCQNILKLIYNVETRDTILVVLSILNNSIIYQHSYF